MLSKSGFYSNKRMFNKRKKKVGSKVVQNFKTFLLVIYTYSFTCNIYIHTVSTRSMQSAGTSQFDSRKKKKKKKDLQTYVNIKLLPTKCSYVL